MRPAQLDAVVLGDDAMGWSALGFAVGEHPCGAVVRLGNTDVVLTGSGEGFESWALRGISDPIAGLPVAPENSQRSTAQPRSGEQQRPVEQRDAADHPNGIRGIDHIVFHSGNVDVTVAAFGAAGIEKRGGRSTDSYGAPMQQVFFWLGDVILEVIGPDERNDRTPGPLRFFGLALWCDDLDGSIASMGPLAGKPKAAVQPGRRIAGIRGSEVGVATPLALMSPHL